MSQNRIIESIQSGLLSVCYRSKNEGIAHRRVIAINFLKSNGKELHNQYIGMVYHKRGMDK